MAVEAAQIRHLHVVGLAYASNVSEAEAAVPGEWPIVLVCSDNKHTNALGIEQCPCSLQKEGPEAFASMSGENVDLLQTGHPSFAVGVPEARYRADDLTFLSGREPQP